MGQKDEIREFIEQRFALGEIFPRSVITDEFEPGFSERNAGLTQPYFAISRYLQHLRDEGLVDFVDKGIYRRVDPNVGPESRPTTPYAPSDTIQGGLERILATYFESRQTVLFSKEVPVAQEFAELQLALQASDPVASRPHLKVVASYGKGNWSHVPWISILDHRITTTTQDGVYPVFLFAADMSGVYLTLNQGTTAKKREVGSARAGDIFLRRAQRIRDVVAPDFEDRFSLSNNLSLHSTTQLGTDYERATIAHRLYAAGSVPDDDELLADLERVLRAYDRYFKEQDKFETPQSTVIATRSTTSLDAIAEELLVPAQWLRTVAQLWDRQRQIIFYGPPGTGKTYIAKRLVEHLSPEREHRTLVQFHPSYAYEDFVQGFRPGPSGEGFALRNGPLLDLATRADASTRVTMLIDEINRGNIAKVFGELYFLLEYRGEKIRLQYDDSEFALPDNLFLIGTMNTTDRSIAQLDAALRRRFQFFSMFPDREPIKGILRRWLGRHRPDMVYVADIVDFANAKMIDRTLMIGPSYFMKHDLDEELFELTWQHSILPYLEEQFLDQPELLEEFELRQLREDTELGDTAMLEAIV